MNHYIAVNQTMKKYLQTIKKYWLPILLTIVFVIGFVYFVFIFPLLNQRKEYVNIRLNSFPYNSVIGVDFKINGEFNPELNEKNFYYISRASYETQELRNTGLKLGLSNEAYNEQTGRRAWTRQGVNDLGGDYIVYLERENTISLLIQNGINTNNLNVEQVYPFISEFMNLPDYDVELVNRFDSGKNSYNLFYGVKHNGIDVYFNSISQYFMTVNVFEGKIVEIFMNNFTISPEQQKELKPLTKISETVLTTGASYYSTQFSPDNPQRSDFGASPDYLPPANITFSQSSFAYIYLFDRNLGNLLLPVIILNGDYIDAAFERGKAKMLVVNQEFM
jgi:hypothetical protein